MSRLAAELRATVLSIAACLLGAIVIPVSPIAGLPLCAAALGNLSLSGRGLAATFLVGASSATAVFIYGETAVVSVAMSLVVVLAVLVMMRLDRPWIALWVATVLFTAAFLGSEVYGALLDGTTFLESMNEAASQVVETVDSLGFAADPSTGNVEDLVQVLSQTWPADYLSTGFVSALLVVVVIGWAGRRNGVAMGSLPKLAAIDLRPHLLWAVIGGIVLLAISRVIPSGGDIVTMVGINLLFIVRPLFAWQGMGVVAERLSRTQAKRSVVSMTYAVAIVAEIVFWVVSLVGLIDFWVNFRKLERSDQGSSGELEEPASSI